MNLDKAVKDLKNHEGNVWTHILSLKREDAERLGYNHAEPWRDLLRSQRNDIAAAMNIPPDHLRWYAAFHDEGYHPHVHMMVWSDDPKEGHLSEQGIRRIKSQLTNEIFHLEMLHLYEDKSQLRDESIKQARQELSRLTQYLTESIGDGPSLEQKLLALAEQLPGHGKMSYGYLPKEQKKLVDQIVDELSAFPVVKDCYRKWLQLQHAVESYYKDDVLKEIPLSQQKDFRPIKNAVIREAERIRLARISFEDDEKALNAETKKTIPDNKLFSALWAKSQNRALGLDCRRDAMAQMEVYAVMGSAAAQYCMGKLFRDGGLVIPDAEEAKGWFEKSASQNFSAAQYALADLLLSDDLLVRDEEQGRHWMETAAGNGNSAAQYRMGKESLRRGDKELAAEWFRSAAEQGNQYAQYMLGKLCLQAGQKEKALEYFSRAAEQGNSYAQFFVDRQDQLHQPGAMLAATRLFRSLAKLFQDKARERVASVMRMDRKRRMALMQKRSAMGIKGPIEEETYGYGQNLSM